MASLWTAAAFAAALGASVAGSASAAVAPGEALVYVGDQQITGGDLAAARQRLRGPMQQADDKWLLETLVNRQLLAQEAAGRGLAWAPAVAARLEAASRDRLRDMLFERRVAGPSEVDDEDVAEALAAGTVRPPVEARVASIAVPTAALAESLAAALAAGADFSELARRYSVERQSGELGGDLGYWREGEVVGPLAEAAWNLAVGEVSPPLAGPDGRYYLVTVSERRPVGRSEQDTVLRGRVRTARIRAARAAFADSLWRAYDGTVDTVALGRLVFRGKRGLHRVPALESGDSALILVRSRAGAVSVGDYVGWLREEESAQRLPVPWHHGQVLGDVQMRTVTTLLYPAEARRLGLDRDPEYVAWRARKLEDLAIDSLRAEAVEGRLITPAALAERVAAVRDSLARPERLLVEVALADNLEGARRLAAEARAGGDLAVSARRHPLPDAANNYWVFGFAPDEDRHGFGEPPALVAAARRIADWPAPAPVAISRPDSGATVFAVYRLLERKPAGVPVGDDERVRALAVRQLRQELTGGIDAAFGALVDSLRTVYADRVRYTPAGRALE